MKIIRIICLSSIYLFIDLCIYEIFIFYGKSSFFFFISILVWILVMLGNKIFRYNISEQWNITATIITFSALCIVANLNIVNRVYTRNRFTILTTLTGIFFIGLLMLKRDVYKKEKLVSSRNATNEDLFNLFYINTSKVHEIAMLIDNKIMKTIEREHISERKLKHSISGSIGKKDVFSNTIGYSNEESLHNKVYENFDIKTTKSIMLRKIYDTAKENSSGELKEGDLVLFKDVNLKQLNIDDTIMILDFLKESKFKNQETDGVELNYNKMFEMMIDDFTIDYSFKYKKNKMDEKSFIIQLPYNSNENFENGYHQNDLQLGKLSIIGIYRGEVDFSKKIGTSLKLLELVKQSINNNTSRNMETEIMKSSSKRPEEQNNPFEINDNKLEGMNSLIDVIAIIQEININ